MPSLIVPAKITNADILRDGGSYVLIGVNVDGTRFEIELPVLKNEDYQRCGYKEPVAINRESDPVSQVAMTWDEATRLAELLSPLIDENIGYGGESRAKEFVELLRLKGNLPS